jgi:hypothetical protein
LNLIYTKWWEEEEGRRGRGGRRRRGWKEREEGMEGAGGGEEMGGRGGGRGRGGGFKINIIVPKKKGLVFIQSVLKFRFCTWILYVNNCKGFFFCFFFSCWRKEMGEGRRPLSTWEAACKVPPILIRT